MNAIVNAERIAFLRRTLGTSCWEWQLYRDPDGYGRATNNGSAVLAHRLAYELFVGPIADGLEIDHLCKNRACVNPDHLEPVTREENMRRGGGFKRLHYGDTCHAGHVLTEETTYPIGETGRLRCAICLSRRQKRYRQRRAAA